MFTLMKSLVTLRLIKLTSLLEKKRKQNDYLLAQNEP